MKVHIVSTSEYIKESIENVATVLNQSKGELQYIAREPLTVDQASLTIPRLKDKAIVESISFDELFNLANTYRIIKSIPQDNFVVVLTTIPNTLNWYSGFSGRNIFVDCEGWEYITESDSKYGIAHQVVENIFQSLMEIDINDINNEPNIHHESIGCINDMCENKMEVMLKMRTGYICNSCTARAAKKNFTATLFHQIHNSLQIIKDGISNYELISQSLEPQPTMVSEQGDINIGSNSIKFEAVPKALFIFYLNHLDGIPVDSLEENHYKEELLHIYRAIRQGGQVETIDRLCLPHVIPGSTFQKVKTTTNKTLINQVGKQLSEFYLINNIQGDGHNLYKINLPKNFLEIKLDI